MTRRWSALLLVVLLVGSVFAAPIAAAASAHGINTDADQHTAVYGHSSSETIAAHDLSQMDAPLELFDDEGEVTELPATYNDSQESPFGLRFDQIEADALTQFPRVSDESDNGASWIKTGQWSNSTTDSTNVTNTVSDADADSVEKVQLSSSGVTAGETSTFNFSENVSLDDPNKRVLFSVLNVNALGGDVELRVVDSAGDYRYTTINSSLNASNESVVANSTGNGYVFQEKVGNLPMAGNGDGTLDSIEKIEVVMLDGDSDVTLAGLDADRKSTIDVAKIARDTDDDGENESVMVEDYWEGGEAPITAYEFGEQFDTAVLHDWTVYDVRYPTSQLPSEELTAEFSNSSESSYPAELAKTGDIYVPSYIDLTHGTLELRVDQGLITDKFGTFRTAQVDSSTDFGNVSDGDWTDRSDTLTEKRNTVTVISGISADQEYRVDMLLYLTSDDKSALEATQAMSTGPTSQGGGFWSNPLNVIGSLVGSAIAALGLGKLLGTGG